MFRYYVPLATNATINPDTPRYRTNYHWEEGSLVPTYLGVYTRIFATRESSKNCILPTQLTIVASA